MRCIPLTSLWGQSPLQRLAHGLFDRREKGLIALLNGLPNAPELRCRPENPARLPSVSGIPDTLDDEHTHRVVHTLSSQEPSRSLYAGRPDAYLQPTRSAWPLFCQEPAPLE